MLTGTAGLFSQKEPWREMKSDLSALLTSLSQEMRRLNDLTICLPLKRLQREQRHVLRHAEWLQQYLYSHMADNEGEFFLFLHDVAMNSEAQILDLWTSMNDRKKCSRSRLQVKSTTCS